MVGGERAPSEQQAVPDQQDGLAHRHDSAHRQLADVQRARLLSAMVAVAGERGAPNATVAQVVAHAGVSRRTFYELFADREECFLAAFDEGIAQATRYVLADYDPESKWAGRLRTTLTSLLTFLDVERGVGWLLVVGSYGAGPVVLECRRRVLAQIIDFVDEGRREIKRGEGPPPLTAEGVVGGVFSLIHSRMVDGGGAPLVGLLNPFMSMTVLPYLGSAAARRELHQPVPAARNGVGRVGLDPLRDLDMRLTYRTVRVLLAIGDRGGQGTCPSNRQVAEDSGIRDQGQISKLLSRLQQLGLIENAAEPRIKGEPNSWTLTQRGNEVQDVISQ
jgi:AcrR family transcriptional regulator